MARPHDPPIDESRSTAILKAISNNRRLQIITHLSDGTERSVSEIEALFPTLSQSALSQHLSKLRKARIVKTRRQSQTIFYSIADQDVVRLLRLLRHIYADDPAMSRTRQRARPAQAGQVRCGKMPERGLSAAPLISRAERGTPE